jgi:hypothetical protein
MDFVVGFLGVEIPCFFPYWVYAVGVGVARLRGSSRISLSCTTLHTDRRDRRTQAAGADRLPLVIGMLRRWRVSSTSGKIRDARSASSLVGRTSGDAGHSCLAKSC